MPVEILWREASRGRPVAAAVARRDRGLLGPNGACKRTSVVMLYRLVAPDAGALLLDGAPALQPPGEPTALKRRIGLVTQDLALFEDLGAEANLHLFGALYGIKGQTLRSRGKALLYTTHYMEEAEHLCDRLVVMDPGRVVAAADLVAQRVEAVAGFGLRCRV